MGGSSSRQPEPGRPARRGVIDEFIRAATTSTSRASSSYAHCYTDNAHCRNRKPRDDLMVSIVRETIPISSTTVGEILAGPNAQRAVASSTTAARPSQPAASLPRRDAPATRAAAKPSKVVRPSVAVVRPTPVQATRTPSKHQAAQDNAPRQAPSTVRPTPAPRTTAAPANNVQNPPISYPNVRLHCTPSGRRLIIISPEPTTSVSTTPAPVSTTTTTPAPKPIATITPKHPISTTTLAPKPTVTSAPKPSTTFFPKPIPTPAPKPATLPIPEPLPKAAPRLVVAPEFYYDSRLEDQEVEEEHLASRNNCDTPVYVLSVTGRFICGFEPGRERFVQVARKLFPSRMEQGLYLGSFEYKEIKSMARTSRHQYTTRTEDISSESSYRRLVLSALLLGCRIRDYEKRWVLVETTDPLVLRMPSQTDAPTELTLTAHTDSWVPGGKDGRLMWAEEQFTVSVKSVMSIKEEGLVLVLCYKPEEPLPNEVQPGSMLTIVCSQSPVSRVTCALNKAYWTLDGVDEPSSYRYTKNSEPIGGWDLLSRIYGPSGQADCQPVNSRIFRIKKAQDTGIVDLNPEQSQAVALYMNDDCRCFAIEAPPGSGKTQTASAMAVSYTGDGVQLFLSTANVPVLNMALALAKLDYGSRRALHFISQDREDAKTSPFAPRSLILRHYKDSREELLELEEMLDTPQDYDDDVVIDKVRVRAKIRRIYNEIYELDYDIIFATVDKVFGRLQRNNEDGNGWIRPDRLQETLKKNVTRVVVDEASQLTEAALNALILSFPKAQIVLIGDSKQLPPFKYSRGDIVSNLAFNSALEVVKNKKNIPVITLKRVYRASKTLIAHYSNTFYSGVLVSGKPEVRRNPLCGFSFNQTSAKRCLFWRVNGQHVQSGTSKKNPSEIQSLKSIINILAETGYGSRHVMIISYYEAQRKQAELALGRSYEVLTVDSAQGREKPVVIVLTTTTTVSKKDGSFFNCPLRCNVAVSRHQEALIVIGHHSVASAPHWSRILNPQYFAHVDSVNAHGSIRRGGRRK